jgi:hypothetical protein
MKKIIFVSLLFLVGTFCFVFVVHFSSYYVNAYNFLPEVYTNAEVDTNSLDRQLARYHLLEMGGGLGADFYIWQNNTFGFYYRFNFYKPYKLMYTDNRFDDEYGFGSIGDIERNLKKSYAFDMYFGLTKKFKINKFEIPLAWALSIFPPRMTFIKYESSDILHESFLDVALITEFNVRYNITNLFFVQMGVLAGINFFFTNGRLFLYDGKSITGDMYFSGFLSANIGVGFTIRSKKDRL